jgi:hypothetical protein
MKAIIKIAFFVLLTSNVTLSNANETNSLPKASVSEVSANKTKQLTQKEANLLVKRVYEIRSIDAGTLSKADKREIRNELLNIQQKLTDPMAGGGIYISAGALILIIILLIIFF